MKTINSQSGHVGRGSANLASGQHGEAGAAPKQGLPHPTSCSSTTRRNRAGQARSAALSFRERSVPTPWRTARAGKALRAQIRAALATSPGSAHTKALLRWLRGASAPKRLQPSSSRSHATSHAAAALPLPPAKAGSTRAAKSRARSSRKHNARAAREQA